MPFASHQDIHQINRAVTASTPSESYLYNINFALLNDWPETFTIATRLSAALINAINRLKTRLGAFFTCILGSKSSTILDFKVAALPR